jgi:hypothetical protein
MINFLSPLETRGVESEKCGLTLTLTAVLKSVVSLPVGWKQLLLGYITQDIVPADFSME